MSNDQRVMLVRRASEGPRRPLLLLAGVLALEVTNALLLEADVADPVLPGERGLHGRGGHRAELLRVGITDHFGAVERREGQVAQRGAAGVADLVGVAGAGRERQVVAGADRDRRVADARGAFPLEDEGGLFVGAVEVARVGGASGLHLVQAGPDLGSARRAAEDPEGPTELRAGLQRARLGLV